MRARSAFPPSCQHLVASNRHGSLRRRQTVQQANDAEAERIFLVAVHNAEECGLEDRRMVVRLSQLEQVYAGHEHVEAEPLYRRSSAMPDRVLGLSIQRSRRCWRTLPMPCRN